MRDSPTIFLSLILFPVIMKQILKPSQNKADPKIYFRDFARSSTWEGVCSKGFFKPVQMFSDCFKVKKPGFPGFSRPECHSFEKSIVICQSWNMCFWRLTYLCCQFFLQIFRPHKNTFSSPIVRCSHTPDNRKMSITGLWKLREWGTETFPIITETTGAYISILSFSLQENW